MSPQASDSFFTSSPRIKRARPSVPNDSKKRARLSSPSRPTIAPEPSKQEPAMGIIVYIVLALFSAMVFLLVVAVMISSKANARLFRNDTNHGDQGATTPKRARAGAEGDKTVDDEIVDGEEEEESALDCTREVMQLIIRRFDASTENDQSSDDEYGYTYHAETDSDWSTTATPLTDATMTTPPTPLPSPLPPSSSDSGSDSGSKHAVTPSVVPDWTGLSWDWVLEGQDELDRDFEAGSTCHIKFESANFEHKVEVEVPSHSHTASSALYQSALMAMDIEEVHEGCEAMLLPFEAVLACPTGEKGTQELFGLGLGINTDCIDHKDQRPQLLRQSTYSHTRRPRCPSLECECEFSRRRLCPLLEEDESSDEDEDEGSFSPSSGGSLTPRCSDGKAFFWILPAVQRTT
ncbi:hypothetical protein A4X09_0g1652 [Tilletia walkeri]|uniref:Uncharacterized protein n=1 Tax=Tilletia walkeri TaxID=117179 RepID=A0A8X7NB61_9BASI|nr:hypothetical protein A4X09_0g1652 [Tilletia walkeri]